MLWPTHFYRTSVSSYLFVSGRPLVQIRLGAPLYADCTQIPPCTGARSQQRMFARRIHCCPPRAAESLFWILLRYAPALGRKERHCSFVRIFEFVEQDRESEFALIEAIGRMFLCAQFRCYAYGPHSQSFRPLQENRLAYRDELRGTRLRPLRQAVPRARCLLQPYLRDRVRRWATGRLKEEGPPQVKGGAS
jgi:hypothetical protein